MSLEMNKIAAAVLTGGVIAMASGFAAELLVPEHELEESVYKVAGVESASEPATSSGPSLDPVLPLLADASAAEGESLAKKCAACHSFEQGGPNKVGPNLYGIVGAKVGGVEGFSYSDGLLGVENETWTYSALNGFLADPRGYAPGTKMSFAGLKKVEDRAAMIAYLRSLAASPEPLPSPDQVSSASGAADVASEAASEAADEAAEAVGEAVSEAADSMTEAASSVVALLAGGDVDNGQKVARKCAACHSFEKGAPDKLGPNLYGIVGADIASKEGYRYSGTLADLEGTWDFEKLDAFLADPRGWAPGTKMGFSGISNDQDRADLILYLRSLSDDPVPLSETN